MALVARRLSSQSSSSSPRSYPHSPQQKRHNGSPLQSNAHSRPDHERSTSAGSVNTMQDRGLHATSTSLPASPSERKKLQKQILTNGSSDRLQETLKQKGMLHALLADPVRFVKSSDKQGQDYTSLGITPVNDPDFAAKQQRKAEQQQHSLLLHTDSAKLNGAVSIDAEPTSSTKAANSNTVSQDLFPYKISLRFPGKVRPVAAGLSNYGNTCYMNSVMQSLIHTPPLTFALLTTDLEGLHGEWGGKPGANFDAVAAMQAFAQRSLQGSRSTNVPQEFNRNLKAFAKPLRQGRQEDAHEYLRFLLEAMQQSCLARAPKSLKPDDPVRQSTFVQKIFGGRLRSRVTCHHCGHNSDTFDPFMDLSLDVRKGINSLTDAFRTFVAKDRLTGSEKYKCDKCKRKVDATKQFTIEKPPPALTIHLKRFTAFGSKISRTVSYDESINVAPYLSINKGPARYRLYAVVHHFGSGPNSGHYVASVRSPSGKWTKMDDSYVSDMPKTGPVNDSSAYILFYLREKDEALEKAISTTSSKLSGFVKSGLNGLVTGSPFTSPFKSKKRKASSALEETPSSGSDSESQLPAKSAKLRHAHPSHPLRSASQAMSLLNSTSRSQSKGSPSDSETQSDQISVPSPNSAPQRAINGSSQKLDHLLSSKPTSTANFYGLEASNTAKKNLASVESTREDSEEIGVAVAREDYESLVDSRPSASTHKVSMPDSDSDNGEDEEDADLSRQSVVSRASMSKKERRRQKKAARASSLGKGGRGVPASPYANVFTMTSTKSPKGSATPTSYSGGNFAGRMKPRPSLP